MQVYPPPGAADPSATSTNVRLMREEVLSELQEDNQFILPLRTRLALLALLTASLCIVMILVPRRGQPQPEQQPIAPSVTPVAPVAPIVKAPPPPPVVEPVTSVKVPPVVAPVTPAKPFSKELAEVEVFAALVRDDVTLEPDRAIKLLTPYTQNADAEVKAAAKKALVPVYAALNERSRTLARTAAEAAEDHLLKEDFAGALDALKSGMDALPPDAPFSEQGKKDLLAVIDKTTRRREDARQTAFADLEEQLRAGNAGAQTKFTALLSHPDPTFRQPAETLKAKLGEETAKLRAEKQKRDETARKAWSELFQKYDAAMVKGDLSAAGAMCRRPPNDPVLTGGVADPRATLSAMADEVTAVQALYDAALARARDEKGPVIILKRNGVKIDGTLSGVEGRQVKLNYHGAEVGASIDEVTSASLSSLVGSDVILKQNLKPALWAVSAYDAPQNGAAEILKLYTAAKMDPPTHWQERIKLEKMKKLTESLEKKLTELTDALAGGEANGDGVKTALDALLPIVDEYEKIEPLNEASRKTITAAQKLVGSRVQQQIVLQNGVVPTADCAVFTSDQISEYREDQKKPNLPKIYGLKLGSGGGTQRFLFRFDGIESALGRSRLKKATLQLYQIESPSSNGAVVGIFALKRAWNPGNGTWSNYDAVKKLDWETPGASKESDINTKDEARVTLDNKNGVWRSFDVTSYMRNVLNGKQPNLGFLMRVINNEPSYQVWFYPETDLDLKRDKTLRPKLVLDVEKEKE